MSHLETLKKIRDFCSTELEHAREYGANMDAPIYVKHAADLAALDAAVYALDAVAEIQKVLAGHYNYNKPDVGAAVYRIKNIIAARSE